MKYYWLKYTISIYNTRSYFELKSLSAQTQLKFWIIQGTKNLTLILVCRYFLNKNICTSSYVILWPKNLKRPESSLSTLHICIDSTIRLVFLLPVFKHGEEYFFLSDILKINSMINERLQCFFTDKN